ncbi:hypothetical protein LEP1GSC062_3948 [Leptospira alexanderi serovar Manhao 3 str. L 60]|uniref:Uncharacterized protein n=1 Tax=Leptospira alexanderi serovar Manhao 3 str. L 60 TaxID=1049759 RepID=V6I9X6_9LEPT|nr:hypothetical protein LEP1GSC062_3948 [Leptospira alexanderi serovar Manhao 3 str. L 60]
MSSIFSPEYGRRVKKDFLHDFSGGKFVYHLGLIQNPSSANGSETLSFTNVGTPTFLNNEKITQKA